MKILKYLIIICSLFLAYSCIKDEGNYDYIELEDFRLDTTGLSYSYGVQQGRELLIIDQPIIASDTTNYEYLWRLFQTTAVSSMTPYDTLSTQRKLSTYIHVEPGTTNTLELRITQKSTGLFKYYTFSVGTIAAIPDGMMVIYEKDGMTDVDIIRGTNALGYPTSILQDTVIRNALSGGLGGMLDGTPASVAANTHGVYLATSTAGINRFKNNSFALDLTSSDLFLGMVPPTELKSQYMYNHGPTFMMYLNNGVGYWARTSTNIGFAGESIFPVNNAAAPYEAAPFVVYILGQNGVIFDKISRQFLYQQSNSSSLVRFPVASSNKFDLRNIGKDLLWMGPKVATTAATGNQNNRTAYFRDIDGSKTWLYIINFNDATNSSEANRNASRVANIDISDLPDIASAKFYETSFAALNTFYATSTKLYSFFYNGATNLYSNLTNPFTAPAGEEITAIRLLTPLNTNYAMRRMAIATWNETTKEGKVYVYKIEVPTAGNFDPDPVVTTHDGKVLLIETKTH